MYITCITSFTSRDTLKKSKKPLVTKTYSVGFNHDAEWSYKNKFKGSSFSGAISESNHLIGLENFGVKTHEPDK